MLPDELLDGLKARFAKSRGGRVSLGADEIAEWPDGIFDELLKAKLICRDAPANVVECRGCEEYCLMPVNIFAAEGHRPARAFVACDQRDDVGRVPVDFSRLAQWTMTLSAFEEAVASFVVAKPSNGMATLKKSKAPVPFRDASAQLLAEIRRRASSQNIPFDSSAMPGRKVDFKAMADGYDREFSSLSPRTFDDYLDGLCSFKRGARETDFYRNLFPECFK